MSDEKIVGIVVVKEDIMNEVVGEPYDAAILGKEMIKAKHRQSKNGSDE